MKFTKYLILIILIIGISSCENSVGPTSNVKNPSFFFAPTNETLEEEGLLCTFSVYKSKIFDSYSNQYTDFSGIDACFYNNSTDAAVYAGTVSFNDWNLPMFASLDSIYLDTLYSYGVTPYNSSFDGANKNWKVSGSSFFQQLSFYIQAPYYQVEISNILPNQIINKAQGFTITWNNYNQPTDGAKIILKQRSSGISFEKESTDNGSISITSTELNSFSSGTLDLILITGNMEIVDLNENGDWGYAVYYSHHDIPINFK